MKSGLRGWVLFILFFWAFGPLQAQELGPGFHEGQRRYLYLCSRRDHHDLQLRRHPGRRRDDR